MNIKVGEEQTISFIPVYILESMITFLAILFGFIFLIATILPLIRHEAWWIRVFDFPRLQIIGLGLLALVFIFLKSGTLPFQLFGGAIGAGIIYQLSRIIPYTQIYPRQVLPPDNIEGDSTVGVLISNVYMKNDQYGKLIEVVKNIYPDLFLALEVNHLWVEKLKELDDLYPYSIKMSQENAYGIMLLSRLPLSSTKVNFLLNKDVPSVEALVELKSGEQFLFYGVHPKPPAPDEADTSIQRDAELVIVGKQARNRSYPVIIAGDLNDVAWSSTTHLFQKISGLLDPRIGRGMFSTFNAKYPLLRWPLDHLFHSRHFKVIKIQLGKFIGSDHFPIFIKLSYEPSDKEEQPTIIPTKEEVLRANKKIKKAK